MASADDKTPNQLQLIVGFWVQVWFEGLKPGKQIAVLRRARRLLAEIRDPELNDDPAVAELIRLNVPAIISIEQLCDKMERIVLDR